VPAQAWIASHRPFNSMRSVLGKPQNDVDSHVQELAFGALMPAGIRMSVAGHVHFFQGVDFGGVRPPQLVVGTGGDSLAPVPPVSMVGADINGRKVINSVTYSGFAYMLWDRLGNVWNGTLFDVSARPLPAHRSLAHLRIMNRRLRTKLSSATWLGITSRSTSRPRHLSKKIGSVPPLAGPRIWQASACSPQICRTSIKLC